MRDGDGKGSFEAAFPALYLTAFRVAYRMIGSVDDAEDVAAEALARALLRWDRVRDLPYRNAWVGRVSANLAIDRYRRRAPVPTVPADLPDPAETVTIRIALAAAMGALPRRQRQAVVLRYLGGLSEDEVAGSLGISRNSVKKHIGRGVTALRLRLGPDWQEARLAVE